MNNIFNRIPWAGIFRTLGILCVITLLLSILWVAYYSRFEVKKTLQMSYYKFDAKGDSLKFNVEHEWVPIDSISQNMIIAVLAAEDKNFYIHDGFPLINGEDSVVTIIPQQHETITQKAAHTVFLTKGDSWAKDILEPYFTLLEEYLWGKNRILEVYLNTVLTGNGIFGVEAASRIYFNKPVGDLTQHEAAFIAALLEKPETVNVENPGEEILSRQKEILLAMGFMMHIKIGKKPVDEKELLPAKPIYKRNWRG